MMTIILVVCPWVQPCAVFSDLASVRKGRLSEGTAGGAAEDLCEEMRGPQSLSGEKQPRGRETGRLLEVGLR